MTIYNFLLRDSTLLTIINSGHDYIALAEVSG